MSHVLLRVSAVVNSGLRTGGALCKTRRPFLYTFRRLFGLCKENITNLKLMLTTYMGQYIIISQPPISQPQVTGCDNNAEQSRNMKNKVICLTGAGFRVFTTAATIATLAFTILLICIHEQVSAYAIAAAVFVFAVCGFACFLCFNHRIIFSPEQSTIKYCALKSVVVPVADITI